MTNTLPWQKTSFTLFVLTMLGEALAGNPPAAPAGQTPETLIKKLGCYVVNILASPALVGVAGAALLLVFGWSKVFGEMNAFQSFKNGVIGVIIVLVAAGVSTTLFGAGCA